MRKILHSRVKEGEKEEGGREIEREGSKAPGEKTGACYIGEAKEEEENEE